MGSGQLGRKSIGSRKEEGGSQERASASFFRVMYLLQRPFESGIQDLKGNFRDGDVLE